MKLKFTTPTIGQLLAMLLFSIAIAFAASLALWWKVSAGYIPVVTFFRESLMAIAAFTFIALFVMLFTGTRK